MKGSLRIATVAGIGIFVHWTFLILLAWIMGIYAWQGGGVWSALQGAAFVIAIFACVVLHELGHALTAMRFGVPTRDITLLPIGGLARLQRMPEQPLQELIVAFAGPLVNVAIALVLFLVILATHPFGTLGEVFEIGGRFFEKLMWINVALFVFNMIPAFPMDGGRILRAGLATSMEYVRATRIAAVTGQTLAVIFGLIGLLLPNPILILIAVFVFLGAQGESQMVQTRSALRGATVRDAIMTEFKTLSLDDRLSSAIDEVVAGPQREFPVVSDGRVVGVLSVQNLLRAVAEGGTIQRVQDAMKTECDSVSPDDDLADAVRRLRDSQCSALPVIEDSSLIGLLTMENVSEWMQIQAALGDEDQRGRPAKPALLGASQSAAETERGDHVPA